MSKETIKLHPGKRKKHGGYTYLSKGKLPPARAYIERYLTGVREGMIRDLGPTENDLTTAQIVLIDRVVTKLGVIRCIEEHIRESTVMEGDRLSTSLRESYLAYNNSVRLSLQALGLDRRSKAAVLAPYEIVEEKKK